MHWGVCFECQLSISKSGYKQIFSFALPGTDKNDGRTRISDDGRPRCCHCLCVEICVLYAATEDSSAFKNLQIARAADSTAEKCTVVALNCHPYISIELLHRLRVCLFGL